MNLKEWFFYIQRLKRLRVSGDIQPEPPPSVELPPVTNGLVSYLEMLDYKGDGIIENRIKEYPEYNATVFGDVLYQNGVIALNGIDQYIRLDTPYMTTAWKPVTMIAKVFVQASSPLQGIFGQPESASYNGRYCVSFTSGILTNYIGSANVPVINSNIILNNWSILGGTLTGVNEQLSPTLFVNNQKQVGSLSFVGNKFSPDFLIGAYKFNGEFNSFSKIQISSFLLYDRVLTDSEMTTIYEYLDSKTVEAIQPIVINSTPKKRKGRK